MADLSRMTDYERRAWEDSIRVLHKPRRQVVPTAVRERITTVATFAGEKFQDLPGAHSVQEIVSRVMDGTLSLTFRPALRTVTAATVLKLYTRNGTTVSSMESIRLLPLEERDHRQPRRRGYISLAVVEGAATAGAVTGAEVATTVTAGTTAGVVVAAVAADAVARSP